MGHTHSHNHSHSTENLTVAFWLNTGFALLELVGGFYTNSVAIMSDALHDIGDSLSLGLAYYLQKKSEKGKDNVYTYGYKRYSLLGAFITSIVLVAVLIGAMVMTFATIPILDPVLSIGIACFILFNVYKNIRSLHKIILQSVPEHLSETEIKKHLSEFAEIREIHDIHSWSMDGEYNVVTFHAVLLEDKTQLELEALKSRIKTKLREADIHHITIEFEIEECDVAHSDVYEH
jgi:Co/Zn/Cd efflux system component